MSYGFSITAATKDEAKAAVAERFATIEGGQVVSAKIDAHASWSLKKA